MDIVEKGLRSLPRHPGNLPFTDVNPAVLAEEVYRSNPKSFKTKADAYMATAHFFEFIYLKRLYGDEDGKIFAPTSTDDLVWRTALLDTRYYLELCAQSFLHRVPHAPQDEANAQRLERTRVAYQMEFGRPLEAPIVVVRAPIADDDDGDDCNRDSDEDEDEDEDDEDEVLLHRGVPFVVGEEESSSESQWSDSMSASVTFGSDVESEGGGSPNKKREREPEPESDAEPVVIATLPIVVKH